MKNISKIISLRGVTRVHFGDVIYPPRGTHGPRRQGTYEIIFIMEGTLHVTMDGVHLDVAAGEACMVAPAHRAYFEFSPSTNTRHQWCSCSPNLLGPAMQRRLKKASPKISCGKMLRRILAAGLECDLPKSPERTRLLESLGCAAMSAYLAEAGEMQTPHPEAVRRAQAWVEEHFSEPIDLRAMAQHAGVSPNYLIKLFRKNLSTTPVDFLWKTRLACSQAWLQETGLTISEIAYRAGFQTPFHFSRRFKKLYGLSPRQARRKYWQPASDSTSVPR